MSFRTAQTVSIRQGVSGRRPRPPHRSFLAVLVAGSVLFGCGEGAPERIPLGEAGPGSAGSVEPLSGPLQAQLDAANQAYRTGDYDRALELFKEVTRADPELAAGWYGVGMTHSAMGNRAAADSAMARVHLLAPELPLVHPGAEAPPNPHPNPSG